MPLTCRLPNRISFDILTGASAKLKRGHVKCDASGSQPFSDNVPLKSIMTKRPSEITKTHGIFIKLLAAVQ